MKPPSRVARAEPPREGPAEDPGGERQRVAVVRSLACSPDVVVLDEPTSGLGRDETAAVLELLMVSVVTTPAGVITRRTLPKVGPSST